MLLAIDISFWNCNNAQIVQLTVQFQTILKGYFNYGLSVDILFHIFSSIVKKNKNLKKNMSDVSYFLFYTDNTETSSSADFSTPIAYASTHDIVPTWKFFEDSIDPLLNRCSYVIKIERRWSKVWGLKWNKKDNSIKNSDGFPRGPWQEVRSAYVKGRIFLAPRRDSFS